MWTSSPTRVGVSCPKIEFSPVCSPRVYEPSESSSPAALPSVRFEYPTACANSELVGYVRFQVPPPAGTERASTVPSLARICPRLIRSCVTRVRRLRLLLSSLEASITVQRVVNTTSSANSTTITANRRVIWVLIA